MRRILASLLVVLFGFSLIAQALFASDPDSNLPACCRRNGKHHCAMMTRSGESSGPVLLAARCPAFPSVNAIPSSQTAGLPGSSSSTRIALEMQSPSLIGIQAHSRISYSQAGQKRGPPSFSS